MLLVAEQLCLALSGKAAVPAISQPDQSVLDTRLEQRVPMSASMKTWNTSKPKRTFS